MSDARAEAFLHFAEHFEAGDAPRYAALARACADTGAAIVGKLAPDAGWDLPLRLFGGVHYLVRAGEVEAFPHDWPALREVLEERTEWFGRWLAEQPVQTNEVQRSWALVPAFLEIARRAGAPLELIELGASAGLNLLFDRYRCRYAEGEAGPAGSALVLTGEERAPVPEPLFGARLAIARRRGIDRSPIDVCSESGVRLLEAFVWADHPARLARLGRAVAIAAADPPELVAGDYVEVLPRLLCDRDPATLTVVFQTASTGYLTSEEYASLRVSIEEAASSSPLAWLSTRRLAEETDEEAADGYGLELQIWPEDDSPRMIERFGYHGQWLDWRARPNRDG